MEDTVKNRRITKADHGKVKSFVFDTLRQREKSEVRKDHEVIWREVDRQVQMKPPTAVNKSGKADEDWHNAIQLGLLADALEILAADVMRLAFPNDRSWFAPHVSIPVEIDENGDPIQDRTRQKKIDGVMRSLMNQQHSDFGFKDRMKLSVKEALTHGGMVFEVVWDQMAKFHGGSKIENLAAPVWQPHSMWNCFPDHSPHIIGTD